MLVGRDRELSMLIDVCRAATAGHGSTVVVRGEPGIGKTSLLAEAGATGTAVDLIHGKHGRRDRRRRSLG